MAITSQVRTVAKRFERDNPKAGKVPLTSGERTADDQLRIIPEPKRKKTICILRNVFA
jgi:hypothetical protein